jgi:hypothetical protein
MAVTQHRPSPIMTAVNAGQLVFSVLAGEDVTIAAECFDALKPMRTSSPCYVSVLAALAVACLLVFGSDVHSETTESEPVNVLFSGFGTLGVVNSRTDFGGTFVRDVSQLPGTSGTRFKADSRLGAQINWQLSNSFEAVGQVVARDRSPLARAADNLEWAFLAYRPTADTTLRLGRVSMDLFLLSDYRNVGFGYLSVRPNVDFYAPMSLSSLDGIDISQAWTVGDAAWRIKGAVGSARYDAFFGRSQFNDVRSLVLSRDKDGLTLRGTVTWADWGIEKNPLALPLKQGLDTVALLPVPNVASQAAAMSAALSFENIRARYTALGLAYDRNNWVVNAEWMRILMHNAPTVSGTAAYVLAGHRFGTFTPFAGLSRSRSLTTPYSAVTWGAELAPLAPILGASVVAKAQTLGQIAADQLNGTRVDQSTVTLGLRWDIDPSYALKLQWDRVKVRHNGTVLWGGERSGGTANVASLVLDFSF